MFSKNVFQKCFPSDTKGETRLSITKVWVRVQVFMSWMQHFFHHFTCRPVEYRSIECPSIILAGRQGVGQLSLSVNGVSVDWYVCRLAHQSIVRFPNKFSSNEERVNWTTLNGPQYNKSIQWMSLWEFLGIPPWDYIHPNPLLLKRYNYRDIELKICVHWKRNTSIERNLEGNIFDIQGTNFYSLKCIHL